MSGDTKSRVFSVRADVDLFDALRERAELEGRSISGEIVFVLKQHLRSTSPRGENRPISGWLKHLEMYDIPETHEEFRAARASVSQRFSRSPRSSAPRSRKTSGRT